jgi:hypothetical protein
MKTREESRNFSMIGAVDVANLDAYGSLHPPSQLNDDSDVLRVADGSSLGQ